MPIVFATYAKILPIVFGDQLAKCEFFCNLLAISLNDFLPPNFFHELTNEEGSEKGIEELTREKIISL